MKQNWEPEVKQGIAKLWTLAVGLVGEDWPGQCDLLAQARAALPA